MKIIVGLILAPLLLTLTALGAYGAVFQPTHRYERGITRQVNHVRVHKVRPGPCVTRYARHWARHLAEPHGDYNLYHSNMGTLLDRCHARMAGEVIAVGNVRPREIVRAWMHSPTHRAVLHNGGYRRVGVGVVHLSTGNWLVVADFVRH